MDQPITLHDRILRCHALEEENRWQEALDLTAPVIADGSPMFESAPLSEQWQILEEHAMALFHLERKEEALPFFDRVLEYELSDEDMARNLAYLNQCPHPPEKWFSLKKYIVGLVMAALAGYALIGQSSCHN